MNKIFLCNQSAEQRARNVILREAKITKTQKRSVHKSGKQKKRREKVKEEIKNIKTTLNT